MRIKFLFFIFSFSLYLVNAQNTFQKTYGKVPHDYAYALAKTNDGGYISTGSSNSYGGSNYFYLFKIDSIGDTLWAKGYNTSSILFGYSIQQTSDSGYIVTGGEGLLKTTKQGDVSWGFYCQGVQFYSVLQTNDGGYILTGTTGATGSSSGMEIYLLKLNSIGIKQWSRKLGGIGDDIGACIKQTSDGGYIILGTTTSFGAGSTDVYLIKTDALGDTLWTKTYGGPATESGSAGRTSLEITSDGGYIIGSFTNSFGAGATDAYLIKTNAAGDTLWTKTYGGTGTEIIYSVKQTHDGGYIFTGYTSSFGAGLNDFYLVKTNAVGDTLWTRAFGGINQDQGQAVVETIDKGYLIAGYTKSFGSGNNDALLIKTDSLGNSSCNQYSTATAFSSQPTQVGTTSTNKVFFTLNINALSPTPKGGGLITDACIVNGIQNYEQQNSLLSIFPNPSNGVFTFTLKDNYSNKIKVCVTNVLGETVFSSMMRNNTSIELQNFPNGIYFVKAETNKTYIQRIIINK